MPTSRICVVSDVPAERIWAKVSEYATWGDWLTFVTEGHIEIYDHIEGYDAKRVPVGAVRACGDFDNPRVREKLVTHDDVTQTISYVVTEPPVWRFPARNYRGMVRVLSLTDRVGSVIEWSGTYDCDQKDEAHMSEHLLRLYPLFVEGLVKAAAE
jgi:hypothetical protein